MKLHHSIVARSTDEPIILAVGFFDGLHRGHQAIIAEALVQRRGGEPVVLLTFRDHPLQFLRPADAPRQLDSLEERINRIAAAGIDELYLLPFDEHIAGIGPQEFLERIVAQDLHARAVVVGESFRFGAGRKGDAVLAAQVLEERGIIFRAVPNVLYEHAKISSSRIRDAVASGSIEQAEAMLGYPYTLQGIVCLGAGRGHDLEFPTANLRCDLRKMLPPDGVYKGIARYDGVDHYGLVSIGTNPTFGEAERSIEVWIRGFSRTIYGDQLRVSGLRFLRPQQRFPTVEALINQMHKDALS